MTCIDYYDGAYGKTIRIAAKNERWLTTLKEKVEEVLGDSLSGLDICSIVDTECSTRIKKLELSKAKKHTTPCIYATKVNDQMSFYWKQDEEELITLIGLIDSLIESERPGHQYLAHEEDDFIIVLSHNE